MRCILVARGDAVPRYGVPVELTDYPFFPRTMMHVDQARLDHLAAQHVTDIDGAPPSMKRFLFATFGYNQGYLLQIVEKPPAGLSAPADFVTCPPAAADGPLYCDYRTSKLAALHRFDSVSRRLRDGDAAYSALEQRIAPLQEAAIARGRMVWDGQLD